ncbi:hypothetical protein ESCO_005962 [Escovopsis weberi]|uniref:MARVEL domain-containing protein n=1 Tax=Escovopsis weberi TaxID=150374 RepID=A0A0M9VRY2_ESCWE|nr:hypothetical protein ESCO_005962 [Escovopsis weberi]
MFASSRWLRIASLVNNILIFCYSVVVVSINSHIINEFSNHGAHIVYQEVIAVATFAIWTFGMTLPLFDRYRGHFAPLSLAFSYLWLTSFIFTTQSWASNKCRFSGPVRGHCSQKKAVMAFSFLTFIFMISGAIIEILLYRSESRLARNGTSTKERVEVIVREETQEVIRTTE